MRWRGRLLLLLMIAIGAILACLFSGPREPRYQAKSLSYWIGEGITEDDRKLLPEAWSEMGTNALPCLVRWVSYEPLSARGAVAVPADKLWRLFGRRLVPYSLTDSYQELRAQRAEGGFGWLGATAAPAIPELVRHLRSTHDPDDGKRILWALAAIGPDSAPALAEILTNGPLKLRAKAAYLLGTLGTNAVVALPALLSALQHGEGHVRVAAACALGNLRLRPDLSVPALEGTLDDPTVDHVPIIYALKNFGDDTRRSVPVLMKQLGDPRREVRDAAADVLLEVAPEALH